MLISLDDVPPGLLRKATVSYHVRFYAHPPPDLCATAALIPADPATVFGKIGIVWDTSGIKSTLNNSPAAMFSYFDDYRFYRNLCRSVLDLGSRS